MRVKMVYILVLIIIISIINDIYFNNNQINTETYVDYNHTDLYLFIFNFHWVKYKSYKFINYVYIPYIKKTFHHKCEFVFYGPNISNIYPIRSNGLEEGGYYSYYTIVKAYHDENKEFDGYFLLNDDSFFDPVVFNEYGYDLTKPIVEGIITEYRTLSRWFWPGYKNYRGITFRQAYLNFREIICDKKSSYGLKYSTSRLCKLNISKTVCGYADFVYIPHNFIKDYVTLLDLAYREGMFLEMALNAVAYMFEYEELKKICGSIKGIGICSHIHPVKFSYLQNRKAIRKYIKKQLKY